MIILSYETAAIIYVHYEVMNSSGQWSFTYVVCEVRYKQFKTQRSVSLEYSHMQLLACIVGNTDVRRIIC